MAALPTTLNDLPVRVLLAVTAILCSVHLMVLVPKGGILLSRAITMIWLNWKLRLPRYVGLLSFWINKVYYCVKWSAWLWLQMGTELLLHKGGKEEYVCNIQFNFSVVSDSLWPHEPQHTTPPCSPPTPWGYSNSSPSSRWCHPAISSSVVPFSSSPQSLPASGSFTMNTWDWYPLERTGWISLQSKGLSRVFSNNTVQKHQFFGTQLPSQSNSHIHTWPLEKP